MRPEFKSRIILNNNAHLGDLLYFVDAKGRKSLKCSFKNKVSPIKTWKKQHGGLQKLNFESPNSQKIIDGGASLDLSFKFFDAKLEIKREDDEGSIERTFYQVVVPTERSLFTLVIKDYSSLDKVEPCAEDIVIQHPELNSEIALVFSFEGSDGRPFMELAVEPFVHGYHGKHHLINLPNQHLGNLHIAAIKVENLPDQIPSFLIAVPYNTTKN